MFFMILGTYRKQTFIDFSLAQGIHDFLMSHCDTRYRSEEISPQGALESSQRSIGLHQEVQQEHKRWRMKNIYFVA